MTRTITAIEPQKKSPNRVNIYLDGEYTFGLSRFQAAWLNIGQLLSDEKISKLIHADGLENAYQKALHFISFRPRSVAEVRNNLSKRGIPEILINETIRRLQDNSLLDDISFSKEWVTNRKEFHPRSQMALRIELRQKGVTDDVINLVLDENPDDDSLALLAAKKYLHRLKDLNKFEFRKKLSSYLSRKGFGYSSINPVFSAVWNDLHPSAEHGESIHSEDY